MDDPPPYQASSTGSRLTVPRNGIPASTRRSMEDENRPLPPGWTRQYDPKTSHQFFVDTNANPPRAIWHHPYDDQQYLSSLGLAERERIQTMHKIPSDADIVAESTDEEDGDDHHDKKSDSKAKVAPSQLPPRSGAAAGPSAAGSTSTAPHEKSKFGRRMKDKLTGTTHEEREAQRQQRAEQERQAYETHTRFRQAMTRATETGQPQYLGKDRDGKDVYVESPYGPQPGGGSAPAGATVYNPYTQGPYANPNARFIRPEIPYQRPYGYGYGGGYGTPLMGGYGMGMPMMGGLMGGMMLGGLLF